jgi:hypothetical protein
LPAAVTDSNLSYDIFRQRLKTHLFKTAFEWHYHMTLCAYDSSFTGRHMALEIVLLTYLLTWMNIALSRDVWGPDVWDPDVWNPDVWIPDVWDSANQFLWQKAKRYAAVISEASSRTGRKLRENRTKSDKVIGEWTMRWDRLGSLQCLRFSRALARQFSEQRAMWNRVEISERSCRRGGNCVKIGEKTTKLFWNEQCAEHSSRSAETSEAQTSET